MKTDGLTIVSALFEQKLLALVLGIPLFITVCITPFIVPIKQYAKLSTRY